SFDCPFEITGRSCKLTKVRSLFDNSPRTSCVVAGLEGFRNASAMRPAACELLASVDLARRERELPEVPSPWFLRCQEHRSARCKSRLPALAAHGLSRSESPPG